MTFFGTPCINIKKASCCAIWTSSSFVLCKVDRPSFNSPNCVRPWWNISPASVMTLGCLPTSERRRARTSTEFQSPALTATTGSVLQFCHLYALIFTSLIWGVPPRSRIGLHDLSLFPFFGDFRHLSMKGQSQFTAARSGTNILKS